MEEIDAFARIISDFGPPEHARAVPPEVIEAYRDYLPPAMIRFWETYGWGDYRAGYYRICDPRPFKPLVKSMFANDPEFDHEDLTVIGYMALCKMDLWSRKGYGIYIDFTESTVLAQYEIINTSTGEKYTQDFLVGSNIIGHIFYDQVIDYYLDAAKTCGFPSLDEVFGFVPALQLGGEPEMKNLQRFKALEYMDFLVQLEPLILIDITKPEPGHPLGRIVKIRRIGSR